MKFIMPKKEMLIETNIEDDFNFYFKPVLGHIFKKRLKMCTKLLAEHKFNRVLDAGYGTGIFFFTLNKIAKEMYGVDKHKKHKEIMKKYKRYGLNLKLITGDISVLPYETEFFTSIVSISTLEHIKNLDIVISEFYRVLEKDGYLFVSFPVKNKITDAFYMVTSLFFKGKLTVHKILNDIHVSSHRGIIRAIEKKFKILEINKFPFFLPLNISFYICLKAQKI